MSSRLSKRAVGLFHFNVQYVAGDPSFAHRYCTQCILPVLELLSANAFLRLSFEISGSGLHFLQTHYKPAVWLLRGLIERRQVELISSTYYPTVWPAFPARDLIKSVELNRELLEELKLPAAPVFFAQEAFFGIGVECLAPYFKVALCKDEHLATYATGNPATSAYQLGPLRILAGSDHLLNGMQRNQGLLSIAASIHRERLDKASATLGTSGQPGRTPDSDWTWFHMGSGHHLVSSFDPDDIAQFYSDADWASLVLQHLRHMSKGGTTFAWVTEWSETFNGLALPNLPHVFEGGWNCDKSDGLHTWMGKHINAWEDDPGTLALAWRSRQKLRECEETLASFPGSVRQQYGMPMKELWKAQLLAESSDPLGWKPLPSEARSGKNAADFVLRAVTALYFELRCKLPSTPKAMPTPASGVLSDAELPVITTVGEGRVEWNCDATGPVASVRVVPQRGEYGISVPLAGEHVEYSPSAKEHVLCRIPISDLPKDRVFLPLANGLIGLGANRYLIRINSSGQPAARISKAARMVHFVCVDASAAAVYRWKFRYFCGDAIEALALANEINVCA